MLEAKTVIKQERMSPVGRALLVIAGLGLMFVVGFVVAVKLLGHPMPEPLAALPKGKVYADAAYDVSDYQEDQRWKYDSLANEVKCLADNMYFEGRGEDLHGKLAIGFTTINRVEHRHFKNSICDVVWFRAVDRNSGKLTAHFSWTLDGESDRPKNMKLYAEITRVAQAMLAEGQHNNIHDFTNGATHYHADYVKPYWAGKMQQVASLGSHIFYQ